MKTKTSITSDPIKNMKWMCQMLSSMINVLGEKQDWVLRYSSKSDLLTLIHEIFAVMTTTPTYYRILWEFWITI